MSATENTDPAVLSAILAAVRVYIENEERSTRRTPTGTTEATAALSAWKYAAWSPLQGYSHRGPLSWRHAI